MQVNKTIFYFIIIFIGSGCVEPFTPDLNEYKELLVITGEITSQEGIQTVNISRSSPLSDPQYIPEQGCSVEVLDNKGNHFDYSETDPGKYSCYIEQQFLSIGTNYKIKVTTSQGKEYQSEYDSMAPAAPVDSIYYKIENRSASPTEPSFPGIQIYLDLKAPENFAKNYLWKLEETWEYRSKYLITFRYEDGEIIHYEPTIDSLWACWMIKDIHGLYTESTENLLQNQKKQIPLNFVSNQSPRLQVRYSLLVKQYSLSDKAYEYWKRQRIETQETGELYDSQPTNAKGNLFCVNNPDEPVLGFFGASAIAEKRVFFDNKFYFQIFNFICEIDTIVNYNDFEDPYYMISLADDGFGAPFGTAREECFDCTKRGGTNIMPKFWKTRNDD
ncbi:MAG: DUF4249 domain-containing protein [Bacteroidales bacterium]|nr:DUF4249 domain-containing protein [Bacteroidales bacterium]